MMLPILLGISLPNVDQIIMKESASFFDKGSQTALNYANRTMLIPIGIFAQAMSIAVLPSMSQQTANGNLKEFKRITGKTLRTILFLTVPCSALMFVISLPIIQTLYQHGKFHASDAIATACALRFYCIGIFAWSCQAILTRGFYAMQDTITTVKTGTVMTLVFCLLNFIAIKFVGQTHPILGIEAIAFNTSLAATLYMIWLFVILRKRMRGLQDKALHMTSVRIIVASIALVAASAIPLSLWNMLLAGHRTGTLNSLAQVIVCSVLGGWAYYKVTQYYQLAELDSVLSMAKSRIAPLKRIVDKLIAKFGIRSNS
jgi:putative peptidoglycan lipid II flippase